MNKDRFEVLIGVPGNMRTLKTEALMRIKTKGKGVPNNYTIKTEEFTPPRKAFSVSLIQVFDTKKAKVVKALTVSERHIGIYDAFSVTLDFTAR